MQQLLTDIKALATYIPSGLNIEITGKTARVSVFLGRSPLAKFEPASRGSDF